MTTAEARRTCKQWHLTLDGGREGWEAVFANGARAFFPRHADRLPVLDIGETR